MNYKFNKKVFSILGSGFILLSLPACDKSKSYSSSKSDSYVVLNDLDAVSSNTTSTSSTTSTNSIIVNSTTGSSTSTSTIFETSYEFDSDTYTSSEYIDDDSNNSFTLTTYDCSILDYFNTLGNNIKNNFNSDDFLEMGKKYFVYCVDFLFYDGEIKGVSFSDLTDRAKEQLLLDITTIDSLICSKYPNYKENIKEGLGTAYNKASEIIREGSKDIRNFSKEKLGEENYAKIGEYKDLFIDTAFGDWDDFVDILGKGRQKVKDWYEGL